MGSMKKGMSAIININHLRKKEQEVILFLVET